MAPLASYACSRGTGNPFLFHVFGYSATETMLPRPVGAGGGVAYILGRKHVRTAEGPHHVAR